MKKVFKQHILSAIILLTIFLIPLTFSMFNISQDNNLDEEEEPLLMEEHQYSDFLSDNYIPKTSDTYYTGNEYGLVQWWDTRFRYRVAIELEELEGVDRYEPVEAYLTFDDNEHYEESARLVSFNATGADEWSSELPIQVWNITYYASMFIHSCTITFLADVSANSNQTYFLYYNEDLADIGLPSYDTNLNCVLAGGKLTVTVGASGDLYEAVLEVGKSVSALYKDAINFHTDDSLSPEKQLAHPNLKFLAHMDEGIGNYVNDSTGNVNAGQLINSPTWTNGIVKYGLDFEQSTSQFVNFGAALEDPGDPFNGASTEFTITAWIKPESITSTQASNHGTYNCFMAKAGEAPSNDIFEIGVNNDGTIHVYLDTEKKDTSADFGDGGNVVPGEWNFIAIKYDSGAMQVRINDDWYSRNAWVSAKDLDEADGSSFTIGSTDHINTYFDGVIDEVAIYNIALSDDEVENNKYGSEISVIQTITEIENGDVFSRYELTWTESFDMHVSDMVTFYYDYNLWSIDRTIYFDSDFNGVSTTSQMAALNTHFDLSGLTQNDQFYYLYDGILIEGLTNDGFIVENYTVIHDAIHTTTKTTLGIFVADFYASGDVFSEINYFKGYVTYDTSTDTVSYNPGAINDFINNADPNNQLHIEFWEYIDHINHTAYSPKLTGEQMIELFENQYMVLKNPMNLYIFEREGGFYNIEVTVTDIDDNPVPGATVQLWNETDHTMTWTEYTDDNGIASFTRMKNGTYIANATYVKYGQPPLAITTPKILEINKNTVDTSGLNKTSFTAVQLTSLNLTINKVNSLGEFQRYLEGAEVSFYINSGSGNEFIGSEYVNEAGNIIFRWQNFTSPEDGNVTFSIKWFDFDPTSVTALGDLDGLAAYPFSNVTFYFYIANFSGVNCSFDNTFDSNLYFTISPDPVFNQMLGERLYFQINFTYIIDGIYVFPVEGATVTYNVILNTKIINTQTLYFTEIGGGLYNLTIDTSNPIESGGENWLSENDYDIEVNAFRAGFIPGGNSISFILDPRTSSLIANETELTAYWGETLMMEVVYTDISFGGSIYIEDAVVEYSVIGVPTAVGSLISYGSGGRYIFSLETTEFPTSDSYVIQITASKQNYQEKYVFIDVNILAIKSLINNSVGVYESKDIAFRESQIFYFTYIEESTSLGLINSETRTYEWTKVIDDDEVDSGAGVLGEVGNGMYYLDFNTETLEIATYKITFTLEKENYAPRGGILILNIVPREFNIILPEEFEESIISTVSGAALEFTIELTDVINGSHIIDANVQITIGGNTFYANETSSGFYKFDIAGADLPDAFFSSQTVSALISIDKVYYESNEEKISIVVGMVEIFPGFPMFYFLIIIIGIAAIAGSLITYRQIQSARIPKFVKKVREMSKNIKGRKSISDSLLYPSKEEYLVKKLGDKWDMLGLSLDEIYGLDKKKRKKFPETHEPEGGVM